MNTGPRMPSKDHDLRQSDLNDSDSRELTCVPAFLGGGGVAFEFLKRALRPPRPGLTLWQPPDILGQTLRGWQAKEANLFGLSKSDHDASKIRN
jgi:hypothetical protein